MFAQGKSAPNDGWRKEYLTRHNEHKDHEAAVKLPALQVGA